MPIATEEKPVGVQDAVQPPRQAGAFAWTPLGIALLAVWAAAGLALIAFDRQLQPVIAGWGGHAAIKSYATLWELCGSIVGVGCFVAVGIWVSWREKDRTVIGFGLTAGLGIAAVEALKHVVGRVRPGQEHDPGAFFGPLGMYNPGKPVDTHSMPSGHTTMAFAMAVALSYRWPRLTWLWFALAAGVGLSRVVTGHHFPADVVLGALLGTLLGLLATRLPVERLWKRAARTPAPADRDERPVS